MTAAPTIDRRLSVAPMMDWTDRHCRYFLRLLAPHALLYTEMVTSAAVLRGNRERLLDFDPREHPVALQLGGSDPQELAQATRIGAEWGYDEINLNVGCPSDRVQTGRFGACLMAEPDLVADCVTAMREACTVPVTVKTRLGIDDRDSYEELAAFIARVRDGGCGTLILHARKALLKGLSPRQNREIPPLRYEIVHRVKRDFPELQVVLNGGLTSRQQIEAQLPFVDGVMLGRQAYHDPWLISELDSWLYGAPPEPVTRSGVARAYACYCERQCAAGVPLQALTRHVLGLFQGRPGARRWRRVLSEEAHRPGAGPEIIERALRHALECGAEDDASTLGDLPPLTDAAPRLAAGP